MGRYWKIVSVVLLFAFYGQAQYIIESTEELISLEKLAQEKVFVHHTGPLVFAGETLYYAYHCFNAQTNRSSEISLIGYVALVNGQGEIVKEQKIKLEDGMAQGDFFINTDTPSGNYKLLGYTQWMKNNGLQQVFKDDVVVINPYLVDQSGLLPNSDADVVENLADRVVPVDSSVIQLKFNKKIFEPREKISFQLVNYKDRLGYGSYTIKIQKKSELPVAPALNAIQYAEGYRNVSKQINKSVGDSLFLPEQRGELLYGNVVDDSNGEPISDAAVVVSIPGPEFLLKFAKTDSHGNFYTYLRKDYKEPIAIVQVQEMANAKVALKKQPKLDLSGLTFGNFRLRPEFAVLIKQRSVWNQLENQFFAVKPDSILLGTPIDPFDGGLPETIRLDDYTRFPTFQETLVELFSFAGYRNGKDGEYIRIAQDFETYNETYNDFPAIIIMDGVFIPDHGALKSFDARNIESISLIRDQFMLGGEGYQGMMVITTKDGDYYKDYTPENGINVEFDKPLPQKNYFRQQYDNEGHTYKQIPDYRSLLFWQPHVELGEGQLEFECFASDIPGEYEVVVDGFTTYGKPISFYQTITIQELQN